MTHCHSMVQSTLRLMDRPVSSCSGTRNQPIYPSLLYAHLLPNPRAYGRTTQGFSQAWLRGRKGQPSITNHTLGRVGKLGMEAHLGTLQAARLFQCPSQAPREAGQCRCLRASQGAGAFSAISVDSRGPTPPAPTQDCQGR